MDVRGRFFLHVFPAAEADLAAGSREQGFDNLDFWFPHRGTLWEGACLAAATLPEYEIAYVRTGQFIRASGRRPRKTCPRNTGRTASRTGASTSGTWGAARRSVRGAGAVAGVRDRRPRTGQFISGEGQLWSAEIAAPTAARTP